MLKLFVFCCYMLVVHTLHAEFEQFYQTAGEEYAICDLRVRKFNRTASVLNGTIHVLINFNDSLMFTLDMFHSRLGNQQFNHFPMKIPSSGLCSFADFLHEHYPQVTAMITNAPSLGECPITIRQMYILDQRLPSELILPIARPGLWKLVVKGYLNGVHVIEFYWFVKITDNDFFQ